MATFWFIAITVLWAGFLVLEGFDFGVGSLHTVLGRDEPGRAAVLGTIDPVWDGNEVWIVVAGAMTFAAFPIWYATMFSGLYLALVVLLVALIVRGVGIVFRGRRNSTSWRRGWSGTIIAGSLLVPLLTGVALGDLLHGLPINASQEYVGTFWDLLGVYPILVGLTFVLLTLLHGCAFLAMKTDRDLRRRTLRLGRWLGPATGAAVVAMVVWTHVVGGGGFLLSVVELAAIGAIISAAVLIVAGQSGWAFVATTAAVIAVVASIFTNLYPNVMVSTLGAANNLTVTNAAAGHYSLVVMTVVLVFLLPVVLMYQGWTYRVFRHRLAAPAGPGPTTPTTAPATH